METKIILKHSYLDQETLIDNMDHRHYHTLQYQKYTGYVIALTIIFNHLPNGCLISLWELGDAHDLVQEYWKHVTQKFVIRSLDYVTTSATHGLPHALHPAFL